MESICSRCLCQAARQSLRRDLALSSSSRTSTRGFSQSTRYAQATPVTAQTTTATNPRPNDKPAATSTSAAQPFSTPLSPSPSKQDLPIQPEQAKQAARIQSSCVAGTKLKGLNFIKGKQDPVALEDHEYPAWLWTVLDSKSNSDNLSAAVEGDLFSKSKKQRRAAAKALRKQQALNPESLAPKVPLNEQTIDLVSGDGTVQGAKDAGYARGELTDFMRDMRRKKIKEANFLKAMG
ncbi:hypothetical protein K431DRAFT_279086 [Polychaeton citri CBS 116435]|uniref:Large ribosomal subunit protein mL54 n=1 Tax=Polychaeton citri CBS 116435 TaxID=1314669 RepID=A0A9P4Q1I2_9PEZI|nr:hypothetical protein K431DRAFT_279086 [Polychaeton citri CBS 116435]